MSIIQRIKKRFQKRADLKNIRDAMFNFLVSNKVYIKEEKAFFSCIQDLNTTTYKFIYKLQNVKILRLIFKHNPIFIINDKYIFSFLGPNNDYNINIGHLFLTKYFPTFLKLNTLQYITHNSPNLDLNSFQIIDLMNFADDQTVNLKPHDLIDFEDPPPNMKEFLTNVDLNLFHVSFLKNIRILSYNVNMTVTEIINIKTLNFPSLKEFSCDNIKGAITVDDIALLSSKFKGITLTNFNEEIFK